MNPNTGNKRMLTGNKATAWGARLAGIEYVPAFPITPQTEIVETLSQWFADETLKGKFTNMDSEHSMFMAAGSAAATGVRVFTASSSQGILYGLESIYTVAGWRVPFVMVNVSRALAAPITLEPDHNDVMSTRDCGLIQLHTETCQEILDFVLMGYKIAEHPLVSIPVLVNMDGFVLSFSREPVVIPDEKAARDFLPTFRPQQPVFRASRPMARASAVFGGGFAETGEAGEELQQNLKDTANKFGLLVIGPNRLGVFSAPDHFNSLFLSPDEIHLPKPGPVALISQSGVFLSLILNQLAGMNIGVHRAVNFGNRVDVEEFEILTAFAKDPAVSVIGLYLESFYDGTRFVELARKVTPEKPIVIWKGGHADRGEAAARSHSSSLAGSYPVFQAACEKASMIEVLGFEEFWLALQVLATVLVPHGEKVLIVSNGGGMGVFLTDLCEHYGLRIPKPSETLQSVLRKKLPGYYSLDNPIDLTGSGTNEQCVETAKLLMNSGEFDCLLMILLPGAEGINTDIAPLLQGRLLEERPAIIGAYGESLFSSLAKELQKNRLPVFPSAENAAQALSILIRRRRILNQAESKSKEEAVPLPANWADEWKKRFRHTPSEMEIKGFLRDHGIPVPARRPIKRPDELSIAAEELGFPLVLKAISSGLQHKTELNGVKLGIKNPEDMATHWSKMQKTWPYSIWAEEQMPDGFDLMVGFHRDLQFGPILLFGSGGKYVEVFQDVRRILLPATTEELSRIVDQTAAGKIIRGTRGEPSLNRNDLLDFLERASQLIVQLSEIESIDFNPVRLYVDRLVVLDAKVTLRRNEWKGDDTNDEPLYR